MVKPMNKDLLEKCGLAKWHEVGYAGKGIRVAVYDDRPFLTEDMKSYASIPQADFPAEAESHNTNVAKCLHEAAPDAEIFCLSALTSDNEKNADWIIANNIDLISTSFTPPAPMLGKRFEKLKESGIVICAASGNAGGDNIKTLAAAAWTIAVGAAEINDDAKTYYSNYGIELDCLSFIPKIRTKYYPEGVRLAGTSFAQPFVAGMLACYMQYAKENGLPYDRAAIKQFISANCKDIYSEGKDIESGFGILTMPDVPEKPPFVPLPPEQNWHNEKSLTTTGLLLNGVERQVQTIQHEGHNYIKLRDLVDDKIFVDYDAEKRLPVLEVRRE